MTAVENICNTVPFRIDPALPHLFRSRAAAGGHIALYSQPYSGTIADRLNA